MGLVTIIKYTVTVIHGKGSTMSTLSPLMPIEGMDDWEQRLDRQDAFWERAVVDRPCVCMQYGRPEPVTPWPVAKDWPTHRDRWMDTEHLCAQFSAGVANTEYRGDALPTAWPNLGPEVFSAFFGMEMEYARETAYGIPNLTDWADVDRVHFSEDNFYWNKVLEMTNALLEAGKNRFYVGMTDLHPGGDCITAFRDPEALNMDLLLHPQAVRDLLERVNETFAFVFNYYAEKLTFAGQACTTWPGIVSRRLWHVPSNDFSCMISKEMFDDFFLAGIRGECQLAAASIYHLDGPGALRHLDSLLDIPELSAIQWVFGAGNGRASDWTEVYRRCQDAGKGIQIIGLGMDELDWLTTSLRPEGVWTSVAVGGADDADHVLDVFSRWT